jgi:hypothetical protein
MVVMTSWCVHIPEIAEEKDKKMCSLFVVCKTRTLVGKECNKFVHFKKTMSLPGDNSRKSFFNKVKLLLYYPREAMYSLFVMCSMIVHVGNKCYTLNWWDKACMQHLLLLSLFDFVLVSLLFTLLLSLLFDLVLDLAEWWERCASILKITSSNLNGGSELTFHSDLLLTARGSSTWALIEFACLLCYPGNTLCSQRLESPGRAG